MNKDQIETRLATEFGSAVEILKTRFPEPMIYVATDKYIEICRFLRDDPYLAFEFLFSMAGVHYPDRFEVVIHLSSSKHIHQLVVKAKLPPENPKIPTLSGIWEAANWYEREAAELFGIVFEGHPDPRPLLLYDDWNYGYPMRKGWTGPDFIPMPDKSKGADE
mgnify:CR=1 FL=1